MAKLRVGVIFGGRSGEHEVSLMSARSVLGALDPEIFELVPIGITKDGRWFSGPDALEALERGETMGLEPVTLLGEPGQSALLHRLPAHALEIFQQIDVVFPVLHGTFGEDGTIQGLFELAEIPYVGAGVLASSVAMDKGLFKTLMKAVEVPVVDWLALDADRLTTDLDQALWEAEALAPYPLFTKPANLGSSVAVNKCLNRSDLIEGLMDAAQYDRRVLVERGLEAREIEVSVLGNEEVEASIPGEIVPGDAFYSYRAKYIDGTSELRIPAPLDPPAVEEIRHLAIRAFKAIDGAGMARVDFLLERRTEKLYLNELNTIPGFTRISMYPKLWEASGLPFTALVGRLVELALARHAQKQRLTRSYGSLG